MAKFIKIKNNIINVDKVYDFGSSYACGRAYEKLDAALAAMNANSNINMIVD